MDEFLEQLIPTGIRLVERTVRFLIGQRPHKREQEDRTVESAPELDPILREMRAEMHERMVFALRHVAFMVESSELEAVGKTICPYGRGWSWSSTSDDRIVATCLVPRDGLAPEQADEIDAPRKAARAKITEALNEMHSAKERGDDDAVAAANKRWQEAQLRCRKYPSGWTGKQYSMDEIEAAWQRILPNQRPLAPLTEVRKAASFQRIAKSLEGWHKQRTKYLRRGVDIGPAPGEYDTPEEAAELKRLIPLQVTEPAVAAVGRTIYPEGRNWWLVEKGRGTETAYEATCLVPRDGMTPEQADEVDRRADRGALPRGLYAPIGWEPREVPFIDMAKAWEQMPEADRPYADWDGDRSAFRWGVGHPADVVRHTLEQIGRSSDIPAFDEWFADQVDQ